MDAAMKTFLDRAQRATGDIRQRVADAFSGPGAVDVNVDGIKQAAVKRVNDIGVALGLDAHRKASIKSVIDSIGK